MEQLRLGVLGAARTSEIAIVTPARILGGRLVAVAGRDPVRTLAFAQVSGVERVLDSYQAVLDDPEVEAIYNPLTNGQHGPWNLRAIASGKHVLSEKPFASNAAEAAKVRDAAAAAGVHVVEAFHYRYHPLMLRVMEVVASGELGAIMSVDSTMAFPIEKADDPRWSFELAGGSMMDVGCYAIHALRTLGTYLGGDPVVVSATAAEHATSPGVDDWLEADLIYPNGVRGHLFSSMVPEVMEFTLTVTGSKGTVFVPNFVLPNVDDRMIVTVDDETRTEELGRRSSYTYQLEAFTLLIRDGVPMPTDADDAVIQMGLIDSCYLAAGLTPRPCLAEG